jgi:hypothetical protein
VGNDREGAPSCDFGGELVHGTLIRGDGRQNQRVR